MISWSENRERTKSFSSSQLLEKLELINGLLQMLANDEDLHDDLQLPQVQIALKHFTGTILNLSHQSKKHVIITILLKVKIVYHLT